MKTKVFASLIIAVMFLSACGSQSSDIAVKDPWVRPAVAGTMDNISGMDDMEATAEPGLGDMESTGEAPMDEMSGMSGGGANMTGAFMVIENKGGKADKLVSAECDAAGTVEIHQTTIENDVAQMSPVESIEIPANGSVELRPGSYHVMLLDLQRDLVAGETVAITLKFESGKEITVDAAIQETAP